MGSERGTDGEFLVALGDEVENDAVDALRQGDVNRLLRQMPAKSHFFGKIYPDPWALAGAWLVRH